MKYSNTNKPIQCFMTQSTCYKGTQKMTVKGVLWHSTGANNPNLKRYVQPDDNAANKAEMIALIGKNAYGNDWNHITRQAGLNCWIGKLADGTVATVQTMPWDFKPWGCGSGSKGSCNNGWIQFEICEDGLTDAAYFKKVYEEACEITAYLCQFFGIDPNGTVKVNGVDVPTILCHADSHKLGLGSNHGDVNHWFLKHGKSMATVRADVAALLKAASPAPDSGTGTAESSGKTLKVGDVVTFTGSKHYANANAASGPACKPGKAKITRIYQLGKSKHPYHLVNVSGGGSTVYGWVDEADIKEAATESAQAPQKWTPKVGDVVNYSGSTHYTSANSSSPKACKGGKAQITAIYQLGKSKHPYHLKRVSGSGATVYGWVDAGTFTKA